MSKFTDAQPRRAILGSTSSFWLQSEETGFDLTHPPTPDSPMIYPRLELTTTASKVTVDPAKSALIIIDMQNFFLSPAVRPSTNSNGHRACKHLIDTAIPAARKAGIRIIWVNWGVTQEDIETMPPAAIRVFGFETTDSTGSAILAPSGKDPRLYCGLGGELGAIKLADGSTVDGGKVLMRDQWNTRLYAPLEELYQNGLQGAAIKGREDVWVHKNRLSAFWNLETDINKKLQELGIQTLFFSGVNTDQCVGGAIQDAFSQGYDCLLLRDASGTSSPTFAQETIEFNVVKSWGFMLDCKDFAEGVDKLEHSPRSN